MISYSHGVCNTVLENLFTNYVTYLKMNDVCGMLLMAKMF